MNKFGKFVCKYRVAIIIVALLLLIPSAIGMVATRINYDILTYLPDDVATIQIQNILSKQFNMGSFAVLIVDDDMRAKDILSMEDKIKEIECVDKVVGVYDILGTQVPHFSLPDDVRERLVQRARHQFLLPLKQELRLMILLRLLMTLEILQRKGVANLRLYRNRGRHEGYFEF